MSIYLTPAVVVSITDADANLPWIGYLSVVTAANISADEAATGYPVSNLANPNTAETWRAESDAEQGIIVADNSSGALDYWAIARHNLGSTGATVRLQKSPDGVAWTDVTEDLTPSNDTAIMYRFTPQTANYWRLLILPGYEAPPEIAVLYLGRLLVGERRIYVGHTPVTMGRNVGVTTGISENGNFLGRVVRSETLKTSVDFKNLTPEWVRESFDPFADASATTPFFWAWRPGDYPDEVGYGWTLAAPVPSNQRPNGMMQVTFDVEAIA